MFDLFVTLIAVNNGRYELLIHRLFAPINNTIMSQQAITRFLKSPQSVLVLAERNVRRCVAQ